MNPLAHTFPETPSQAPREGSFDLIVRDASSVAIYWDLARTAEPPHEGSRLCVRYTDAAGETETLILPHQAGHVIVELPGEGRWYKFALGWLDSEKFLRIAGASAELPAPLKRSAPQSDAKPGGSRFRHRGSIFFPLAMGAERSGGFPRGF